MVKKEPRHLARQKRRFKIRKKIKGTANVPRLSVFRSNMHIYAQLIDDTKGFTLAAASTVESAISKNLKCNSNVEAAKIVGEALGKKALEKGIQKIVFDRSGYLFHGRVKALADGARSAGLNF